MRIETILRKQLRLKDHRVSEVVEEGTVLVAVVEHIPGRAYRCSGYGGRTFRVHSKQKEREWKALPLGEQGLVLRYAPVRVRCGRCEARVERIPWAERWQRLTRGLFGKLAWLTRELSISACAKFLGLDWKTVASAITAAVKWGREKRGRIAPTVIGIDEVSRRKGHKYLTLVYDLEQRRLLWAGEDRHAKTMESFFSFLGDQKRSIKTVSCDMWAPYIDAVRKNLPEARIVFDRFHVTAHLSKAVDEVRRSTWRALPKEERPSFKRTRFLWLKNPWNLAPRQKRQLNVLCRQTNAPIVRAYYLKEALRKFWEYRSPSWSRPYLEEWLHAAKRSKLEPFAKFARMIESHLDGILSWTDLRVSSGAVEGLNNKVKAVSHRSYGFRHTATYIDAIWHNLAKLPLPYNS